MNITVADERILLFSEKISSRDAQDQAFAKKLDAFGTINKVASFLSKPKDEDFELIYQEHRFEPFWHVVCKAHYVFDRTTEYQMMASGPEVQSVTIEGKDYQPKHERISFRGLDHCQIDKNQEVFVHGMTEEKQERLAEYVQFPSHDIVPEKLATSLPKGAIIVPPHVRASTIVRELLAEMMQGIKADKIFEEDVQVTKVDLCYRPVFAFQYRWKPKSKEAIVEVDGLTGAVQVGTQTFEQYMGKVLDKNFLFDVGVDAASMIVPGGGIAVRVAKKYMDIRAEKKKK